MSPLVRKLFSPYGRLSRAGWWRWGILYPIGIAAGAFILDAYVFKIEFIPAEGSVGNRVLHDAFFLSASNLVAWLIMVPVMILSIKRFHGLNMSGWWQLSYVPMYFVSPSLVETGLKMGPFMYFGMVVLAAMLILSFLQLFIGGTRGENKYGPDPRELRLAEAR